MTVIPPGFGLFTIPALHPGSPREAVVTCGYAISGAPLNPFEEAEEIWTCFSDNLLPVLDADVTWGPVRVRRNVGGVEEVGEGSSSNVGGSASERVPSNVALLVRKSTNLAGRQNRGRWYWPWALDEDDVGETGVITNGTVAGFQAAFGGFHADMVAADLPEHILHDADGVPPTLMTSYIVEGLVATQRRRLGRR